MADAIAAFGGDPAALEAARRDRRTCSATSRSTSSRARSSRPRTCPSGSSRHRGPDPRAGRLHGRGGPRRHRADGAAPRRPGAARRVIVAVEARGRAVDGLVATVGEATVAPGASNVIPGRVALQRRRPPPRRRVRGAGVAALAPASGRSRRGAVSPRLDGGQTTRRGRRRAAPGPLGALETPATHTGVRAQRLAERRRPRRLASSPALCAAA